MPWILLLLMLALPARGSEILQVAVAANFKTTLESINPLFEQQTGVRVVVSSASTGTLYSQVRHGAPFQVLLAADSATPRRLVEEGVADASGRFCYARGELVLAGGDLAALADPGASLAIANPLTAPYGAAAREILERREFRAGRDRKLVRGHNVAQAYQYWHSGNTALALVPRALAGAGATPIPRDWYAPILQEAVLLQPGQGSQAARNYLDWLGSDPVQGIIQRAGYGDCR